MPKPRPDRQQAVLHLGLGQSQSPSPLPLRAEITNLLALPRGRLFLKRLFWDFLGFDQLNQPISFDVLPQQKRKDVAKGFVLGLAGGLYVYHIQMLTAELSAETEKPLLARLGQTWPAVMVVFSNFSQTEWDFCWQRAAGAGKVRIEVDAEDPAIVKVAHLIASLAADSGDARGWPELELPKRLDQTFAEPPLRTRPLSSLDTLGQMLQDFGRWQLLSAEQERELSRRWRNEGDAQAREQLICANWRLAVWSACRFQGRGLDLEDLIQEGCQGLLIALDHYDPEREWRFSTYALAWVQRAIQRAVLAKSFLIHVPYHLAEDGRTRMPSEAAQCAPIEKRVFAKRREAKRPTSTYLKRLYQARLAMRTRQGSGGVAVVSRLLIDNRSRTAEELADWEQSLGIVERAVRLLPERYQVVIRYRFGLNEHHEVRTLQDIANQFGITRERVRQIEIIAIRKLHFLLRKQFFKD